MAPTTIPLLCTTAASESAAVDLGVIECVLVMTPQEFRKIFPGCDHEGNRTRLRRCCKASENGAGGGRPPARTWRQPTTQAAKWTLAAIDLSSHATGDIGQVSVALWRERKRSPAVGGFFF